MKGEYKGSCNRTDCQKPNSAVWYNHATHKYYCEECAKKINQYNHSDAIDMFGHELCMLMLDLEADAYSVASNYIKTELEYINAHKDYIDSTILGGMCMPISKADQLAKEVPIRTEPKIGRNDPCTCGSGVKYKKCCAK